MSLSLVVLAAGVGSRYGGPKQIDRVGPGGATLVDYAAFDARRGGFDKLVLVVREGMADQMREAVGDRIARAFPVEYAVQSASLPAGFVAAAGRAKPWGTGHATLSAKHLLDGPFAVVNADDFYGAGSYRALALALREPAGEAVPVHALVGFPLAETLSPHGSVSRAVCEVDAAGRLEAIREIVTIERDGSAARYRDDSGAWRPLAADTKVSLNCWGFREAMLAELERGFAEFLARSAGSATAEFFLPAAVQAALAAGRARVRVLEGGGPWAGLTNPGDRPRLVALLERLTAEGFYPAELWA